MYGIFNVLLERQDNGNFGFNIVDQAYESSLELAENTMMTLTKYLEPLSDQEKQFVGILLFNKDAIKVEKRMFTYMKYNRGYALSIMYSIKYELMGEVQDAIIPLHYAEIDQNTHVDMLKGVMEQVHREHSKVPFLNGTYLGTMLQNCKNDKVIGYKSL